MDYTIIDAHAHLWLRQDTVVDGLPIRTLENGRSEFMGEIRQMVPPFMVDGVNSAEVFLSNMDYAQVAAAVITQEFIDGIQNDYLSEVVSHYPNRFFVCGMCEFRKPGFLEQAKELIAKGFKAIKIPAQRLLLKEGRVMLNNEEMMQMFHSMEEQNVMLSIDLADGATQVPRGGDTGSGDGRDYSGMSPPKNSCRALRNGDTSGLERTNPPGTSSQCDD